MKKHMVLIVGLFYPQPSPTGKCAESYVDLLKDQYDISVICIADTDRSPYVYNNKTVFPVGSAYMLFQNWLHKRHFPILIQKLVKLPTHVINQFVHPNLLHSYISVAEEQLNKLHKEKAVDVIFSVGAPMAAHVAAKNFRDRHPEIRWVTYTVDSYASQNMYSRRYNKALSFETRILADSDHVLLSEEIYEHSTELYKTFASKCEILPYLMPPTPQISEDEQFFDSNKINMVFAGRFYKQIRNPEYLLQLASEMDERCVLHLYCQSDCDNLVDEYVRRSGGRIIRHTPVSATQIQQIYMQADFLVSVGNNTAEFKPSKTFEYIASGKPIINIYYPGQYDAVLDKYPLALQLERDDPLGQAIEKLQTFIQHNNKKVLPREIIEKIYFRHGSENINKILEDCMSEQ